ncbi:hypothetical protein D3C81_1088260 [compost metagenome]
MSSTCGSCPVLRARRCFAIARKISRKVRSPTSVPRSRTTSDPRSLSAIMRRQSERAVSGETEKIGPALICRISHTRMIASMSRRVNGPGEQSAYDVILTCHPVIPFIECYNFNFKCHTLVAGFFLRMINQSGGLVAAPHHPRKVTRPRACIANPVDKERAVQSALLPALSARSAAIEPRQHPDIGASLVR